MTRGLNRAGRRLAAVVAVALVGITAFGAVAPAASTADTTKFCAANAQLQTKLDNLNSGSSTKFNASLYKDAGKAFKTAAKNAPKKVKKAMTQIGSFLSALGGGDAVAAAKALSSTNGKNYAKAIVTWSTYVATTCP